MWPSQSRFESGRSPSAVEQGSSGSHKARSPGALPGAATCNPPGGGSNLILAVERNGLLAGLISQRQHGFDSLLPPPSRGCSDNGSTPPWHGGSLGSSPSSSTGRMDRTLRPAAECMPLCRSWSCAPILPTLGEVANRDGNCFASSHMRVRVPSSPPSLTIPTGRGNGFRSRQVWVRIPS